jgi:prepilin-type N-terminal cleavage/methylation domain-containing protein
MTGHSAMSKLIAEQRGITLVEIMIAVAIIGVGLAALSSAIPLAAYGIQEGNQLSTATFLASQRLEQVRNARWEVGPPEVDNLGVGSTAAPVSGLVTTFPDENPMAAPYAGYTRTVRITDCAAGAGCSTVVTADLRQVTVTVGYRPMTGLGMAPQGTVKPTVLTMYLTRR